MPIRENEGKWSRSSSLRDSTAKKAHPLNFTYRAVASHHIVSCESLSRLSKDRQNQIVRKGYNVNHQENLVILPMNDQISCQYNIPLHKSNHTDSEIITQYEERTGEDNVSDLSEIIVGEMDDGMLEADISTLNALLGYHKVVAKKLALKLKSISCDTKPRQYIDKIDDVSTDILSDITAFDLLLILKGKNMEAGEGGCLICQEKNKRKKHWKIARRTIFKWNKTIPSPSTVESFCFMGDRIRLLSIREQVLNKKS